MFFKFFNEFQNFKHFVELFHVYMIIQTKENNCITFTSFAIQFPFALLYIELFTTFKFRPSAVCEFSRHPQCSNKLRSYIFTNLKECQKHLKIWCRSKQMKG